MEEQARSLPRPLRIFGITLAAIGLTTLFVYLGFPYERLGPVLSERISRSGTIELSIGHVSPGPPWLGPNLVLEQVRVRLADGHVLSAPEIRMRPAFSFSWLRGRPALAIDAQLPAGEIHGVLTLGDPVRFEGDAQNLDLKALGLDSLTQGIALEGAADLVLALDFGASGAEGPVSLAARSGTLGHPALPLSIPYEELHGELVFGGDTTLRIESLDIRSDLGTGSIGGTVGRAANPSAAPLDLQIEIQAAPAMQRALRAQGIRLGRDGSAKLHIAGTADAPVVR